MTEREDIARLYQEVNNLKIQISNMKAEAQAKEVRWLRAGMMGLGAVLLAVAGWAWSQISDLVSLNVGGPK